jgi:RND family efflux transporter MFP subunit
VIVPGRTANVPAEVGGVIEAVKFEKGDFVPKDAVVVEIAKKRHWVMVESARAKLKGLELALKHAERNMAMKKEVYSKNYGTMQKVLEAEAEVALTKNKVEEAEKELQLAQLNLKACSVKAPFAGYLTERFKEPHEAVGQLEKLFSIADVSRVYAVGNVPEQLLGSFKKGAEAFFTDPYGRKRKGVVDKVEVALNPESKTAKVNLLLDNDELDLRIGMTGTLALE